MKGQTDNVNEFSGKDVDAEDHSGSSRWNIVARLHEILVRVGRIGGAQDRHHAGLIARFEAVMGRQEGLFEKLDAQHEAVLQRMKRWDEKFAAQQVAISERMTELQTVAEAQQSLNELMARIDKDLVTGLENFTQAFNRVDTSMIDGFNDVSKVIGQSNELFVNNVSGMAKDLHENLGGYSEAIVTDYDKIAHAIAHFANTLERLRESMKGLETQIDAMHIRVARNIMSDNRP